MDNVKFIDLKPHFNFRYVYPDDTAIPRDGFIGIHNLIVRESNYKFGIIANGGVSALFERNPDGAHLITCEGQTIKADFTCDKAHIFGFAAWGMYKENFRFVFGGSAKECPIGFSDLSKHVKDEPFIQFAADMDENDCFADKFITHNAYHGFISKDMSVNTYVGTVAFGEPKPMKEIILPDNFFVYIAAITLTNG
jgi:hypothetical protein